MVYFFTIGVCFSMLKTYAQSNFNIAIDAQLDTLCEGFTNDDDSDLGSSILVLQDGYLIVGGGTAPELCGWIGDKNLENRF